MTPPITAAPAEEPEEPQRRARSRRPKRTRRANGEGTIYQRKDGLYAAQVYVTQPDQTRKRATVYGKTWDEVHDELVRLKNNERQGIPTPVSSTPLGDYLDYWLEHVVKPDARPATYRSYELSVRLYLKPGLGKKRLNKLTAPDIRVWLNTVRETCLCCAQGKDAKRPKDHKDPQKRQRCCAIGQCCQSYPSPRTVQYLHAILRSALQQAVRDDLLARNVAKNVRAPKGQRRQLPSLSASEAAKLLRTARADRLHALYAVMLGLGLRRGEALGLRWTDVEFNECENCRGLGELKGVPCSPCGNTGQTAVIHVRQTLQRTKDGLRFLGTKTQRSTRDIAVPGSLVKVLREHRKRQMAERLAAGERWREHYLVFTTSIGTPIEPRNLNRSFAKLCDAAGVRRVRLHDLRHTCASLLRARGVDLSAIQDILGHEEYRTTADFYIDVKLDEQRKALQTLDDLFADGPLQ
ncbi:hypothetical protein TH66_21290 [Carbonactinospora thermoautotrophica]|uniref:Integrase n=1 Tax=Carbonactinospora thermoautotrophica TaxID=1469144 RepID=A0A132MJH0_9ACTN|nr:tyrosine-type recombinase/integrase [Carbonactinospora thermoautotrophica]KWW97913.1 hypothetical protein TH66_21290 [Carbonactinospora thermoautotrophica]KWX07657.1 hypothetical protein TR74_18065 [Carbonactinospora thermoautotrophica]